MTDHVTPGEFWDLCSRHDWTYEYSDDYSKWERGRSQRARLTALAEAHEELRPIFAAWRAYIFAGPAYGTERGPYPERPADDQEQQRAA